MWSHPSIVQLKDVKRPQSLQSFNNMWQGEVADSSAYTKAQCQGTCLFSLVLDIQRFMSWCHLLGPWWASWLCNYEVCCSRGFMCAVRRDTSKEDRRGVELIQLFPRGRRAELCTSNIRRWDPANPLCLQGAATEGKCFVTSRCHTRSAALNRG